MNAHHFISYSRRDAVDFVTKLSLELQSGRPPFRVWEDVTNIHGGQDWEREINRAITRCETLIFVATADSLHDKSVCHDEWSMALRCKKPVIPLIADSLTGQTELQMPLRLNRRQAIDFTGDFTAALAKLRKALLWRRSTEGQLKTAEELFADAQRDLQYARDESLRLRIQEEMDALQKEIDRLRSVADDPDAAQAKVNQRVRAAQDRERQHAKPAPRRATTKFINPPPDRAPLAYQNRFVETKMVADFLHDKGIRLLTVSGRPGIGKTAMVCRVLEHVERGLLPDDLGALEVDGIIYLSAVGTHQISVENLFNDLTELLPTAEAERMRGVFADAHATIESKLRHLLESFVGRRVIVLLDNFENLIEPETREFMHEHQAMESVLKSVLEVSHHDVKLIITTRLEPREMALIEPGHQWQLPLDKGLPTLYATKLLKAMDGAGSLGLRAASDELLSQVCERTQGNPRALEAFVAILRADRSATLEELLSDRRQLLPEHVAHVLVGEAFHRLEPTAQRVMEALAAYARPVTAAAVDFALEPFVPGCDAAALLKRLVNMHFVRKVKGCFYLHPVDCEYALSQIPEGSPADRSNEQPTYTKHTLYHRGADYFHEIRKERQEWQTLADIDPQRDEFALRCAGGDWDTAAYVLSDIEETLMNWGHWRIVAEMHQQLMGNLEELGLQEFNLGGLAIVQATIGDMKAAAQFGEQTLAVARRRKDQSAIGYRANMQGHILNECGELDRAVDALHEGLAIAENLGDKYLAANCLQLLAMCHLNLGDVQLALQRVEAARVLVEDGGAPDIKSNVYMVLGNIMNTLGRTAESTRAYQVVLNIEQERKNRRGEISAEANLASNDVVLGQAERGLARFEQCLKIARQAGFRSAEAHFRAFIGDTYIFQDKLHEAVTELQAAGKQAEELGHWVSNDAKGVLALCQMCLGNLDEALELASATLARCFPSQLADRKLLVSSILLRQGRSDAARPALLEAYDQALRAIENHDECFAAHQQVGVSLCGLAICGESPRWDETRAAFHRAREITRDAGRIHRALLEFGELAKAAPPALQTQMDQARAALAGT